ncbi:hypothetical protein SAMN04487760_10477 [Lachnospiraceae bacterium G41]|nr:hypothetical protein SAMN04487760_10477 [Lachnospiraceae bacterium G41]
MSSNKTDWYNSLCSGYLHAIEHKIGIKRNISKTYAGKIISDRNECAEFIKQKLYAGEPIMVCRYGGDELNVTAAADAYINGFAKSRIIKYHKKRLIYYSAGVFPESIDILVRFGKEMMDDSSEMDVLGVWNNIMEDYVIEKYGPKDLMITGLNSLEPWYLPENPWSKALKGKRVLVISPFIMTIKEQYEKREKIFPGTEILPDFDLQLLKAVVSGGGQIDERFGDWFEALDYMYNKSMEIGFDVAILGCASYGFPLAAKFKKAGKEAIQLGGASQLLFGIKGARWDNHPVISKLYNDAWVRPSVEEHFSNINIIENGCYW